MTTSEQDLATVQNLFERIQSRMLRSIELGAMLVDLNAELSGDVVALQAAVSNIIGSLQAAQALDAQLTTQLNSGTPGLTPDQGNAIHTGIQGLIAQIAAALLPVAPVQPPVQVPGTPSAS